MYYKNTFASQNNTNFINNIPIFNVLQIKIVNIQISNIRTWISFDSNGYVYLELILFSNIKGMLYFIEYNILSIKQDNR